MRLRGGFALAAVASAAAMGFWAGSRSRDPGVVKAAVRAPAQAPADGKLRIIVSGAHPDDAEYRGAGVALKWARLGHHVKFVSTTNGDIGHWQMAGGPLAQRRTREVQEVARRWGVTTEVLDIHDGEIMPTLENRRIITRLIRQWNADVVITHRPWDYHPDHRYTSILVQDSAYMVTVPFFCPDTPPLKRNPVYLYAPDRFEKPVPFRADVAVAIDDVIEPTLDALLVMESQIHEGGANGHAGLYPADEAARKKRHEEVRKNLAARYASYAERYRQALIERYGKERGSQVRYAQAFELCEYGRMPSKEELAQIFPF
ncbi:MAG: PIG-L family deacetylase [Bryobacterales bacterium]|nr:PIG-L family deacetylase [Bryobacteraceae bacterium]MDW8354552.1 PIG-L family deacetylase [Bryobacterales bacterium]